MQPSHELFLQIGSSLLVYIGRRLTVPKDTDGVQPNALGNFQGYRAGDPPPFPTKGRLFNQMFQNPWESLAYLLGEWGVVDRKPFNANSELSQNYAVRILRDADELPSIWDARFHDRFPNALEQILPIYFTIAVEHFVVEPDYAEDLEKSWKHRLPASNWPFQSPAVWAHDMACFAKAGYAIKADGQYSWTTRVRPFFQKSSIWDANGKWSEKNDLVYLRKDAENAWNSIPLASADEFFSGRRSLKYLLLLNWVDGKWLTPEESFERVKAGKVSLGMLNHRAFQAKYLIDKYVLPDHEEDQVV